MHWKVCFEMSIQDFIGHCLPEPQAGFWLCRKVMSCFTSGRWLLSQLCIIALVTGLCAALGRGTAWLHAGRLCRSGLEQGPLDEAWPSAFLSVASRQQGQHPCPLPHPLRDGVHSRAHGGLWPPLPPLCSAVTCTTFLGQTPFSLSGDNKSSSSSSSAPL